MAKTLEEASYEDLGWGEVYGGSKEQLQALGLGVGSRFPGEHAGPKPGCDLRATDPRGYRVRISEASWRGGYAAHVTFPFVPPPPWRRRADRGAGSVVAEGVTMVRHPYADVYRGTGDDLVKARLVERAHLPGQPGMAKGTVSIRADGAVAEGHPNARKRGMEEPGSRTVQKVSTRLLEVRVKVSREVQERRGAAEKEAHDAWLRHAYSLPRPPLLQPLAGAPTTPRRAATPTPSALPLDDIAERMLASLGECAADVARVRAGAERWLKSLAVNAAQDKGLQRFLAALDTVDDDEGEDDE